MFTFSKPVGEINEQDLLALIDGRVVENRQLEYKRDLPGGTDRDKRELVRDVVAFANSAGGHIVFGYGEPSAVSNAVDYTKFRRLQVGLRADGVLAMVPYDERRAENGHESVTEKFVHDAVMPVNDFNGLSPEAP